LKTYSELNKVRENLTEEEKKVYDICIDTLKEKAEERFTSCKPLYSAIHEQAAQEETKTCGACGSLFIEKDTLYTKDIPELLSKIKSKVSSTVETVGCFDSIAKKVEAKPLIFIDLGAQFADVIESKGYDDYMHRIFLTTNEVRHGELLQRVAKIPIRGDTFIEAHQGAGKTIIAVSGFCGLNIASARGEEVENEIDLNTIIMIDRSTKVEAFWEAMKKIITSSKTRQEVIVKLYKLLEHDMFRIDDYSTDKQVIEWGLKYIPRKDLEREISRGLSWLSHVKRFKKIKYIFDNGRFIFKRVDLADQASMKSFRKCIKKSQCSLDTVYVSNIAEYLEPEQFQAYKEEVLKLLKGHKALLIDSSLSREANGIAQRLFTDPEKEVNIWGVPPKHILRSQVQKSEQ
jgi:hypothetical protein